MEPYPLVTIKNAAHHLGVPYRQLLELARNDDFPHYKVGQSRRLVSFPEVLEYIKVSRGDIDA